jgi:serine/threonine-protein kinase HipA
VQFVRPERVDACTSGETDSVTWLDESEVAERLRMLRADHSAWRTPRDTGQFSLAGAQPKTALLFSDGRWGVPSGRVPTTHILKPPTGEFDGHAENEHFCLNLARRLGLPTASSRIEHFADETAIVIERYDRARIPGGFIRLHQEDMCQAMGIPPMTKYENEGGPGTKHITEMLRTHSTSSSEDISVFFNALIFNWLIGGTDAHGKNYSFLIGPGRVRFAPLYDIASALPYDDLQFRKLKLAMRVGKKYRLKDIGWSDWKKLASATGLRDEGAPERITKFANNLLQQISVVRNQVKDEGVQHSIIDRLYDSITAHTENCIEKMEIEQNNDTQ